MRGSANLFVKRMKSTRSRWLKAIHKKFGHEWRQWATSMAAKDEGAKCEDFGVVRRVNCL